MKKVREELYKELNESSATSKKGFHDNLEQDTLDNDNFRKVIYTGKNMQLVLMTLKPGENIGMEHHPPDQFFRFEAGTGECIINGNVYKIRDGYSILIPGGAEHDIINTGKVALQMYTLYSPPNHTDQVVHTTKEVAKTAEKSGKDKFRGKTTE